MEVVTEVAISQLTSGAQAPKRARRTVAKEKRITELKRRFDENLISLAEYIRGLSGHTNLQIKNLHCAYSHIMFIKVYSSSLSCLLILGELAQKWKK